MAQQGRATEVDRHVGRRIRERRLLLGLTQQQLAENLSITYQQTHKYENGVNRVSAGRLLQLAEALGVPVGYFFEGTTAHQSRVKLHSESVIELMQNYTSIPDPEVRRTLRSCVRSAAERYRPCPDS